MKEIIKKSEEAGRRRGALGKGSVNRCEIHHLLSSFYPKSAELCNNTFTHNRKKREQKVQSKEKKQLLLQQ